MSGCNSDHLIQTGNKVAAFNSLLKTSKSPVIVFFYSKNCGHCHTLMPYFEKYRALCTSKRLPLVLIMVCAETAPEILESRGIDAFPQIFIYKNNMKVDEVVGANVEKLDEVFKKYFL